MSFAPVEPEGGRRQPVVMLLDEFEAIRLADWEGMKQEDAALEMQVSRPTFGRVLEAAHRKVAEALFHGKPLRIEGGSICTQESCGPRDCPRWSWSPAERAAYGGPTSALPCGRSLPGACGRPQPARRGSCVAGKKGESS